MWDGGVWHEMKWNPDSWIMRVISWKLYSCFLAAAALADHVSSHVTDQKRHFVKHLRKLHKANMLSAKTQSFSQNKSSGEQFCVEYFPAVLHGILWTNPEIQSCFGSISLRIQNQWRELNPSLRQQRVQTTQNHGTGSLSTGMRVPERRKVIGHCLKIEKKKHVLYTI